MNTLSCMEKIFNKIKSYKFFVLISFFVLTMFLYCFPKLASGTIPGFIYRGIVLLLFVPFVAVCLYKNNLLKNRKLVFCAFLYLFCAIISLSTYRLKTDIQISGSLIVQSVGDIIINSLLCFLFIDCLDFDNEKQMECSLFFINFLCLFAIIFSLFKDSQSIKGLFNNFDHSNYDITSIFVDKNSFGLLLFIGAASNTLYSIERRPWFLVLSVVYFLYSILIRAKSASLVIFIVLLYSFIVIFKNLFAKNRKITIIISSSLLLILGLLLSLTLAKVGWFSKLYNVLFAKYGLFYDAKVVFLDRLNNWKNLVPASNNPLVIIFGYGERIYRPICNSAIDNSFLCNYLSGGIIKLILFTLFISYLYIYVLKLNKRQIAFIVVLSACLIYGLFQDYYLQGFNFSSLGFLIAIKLSITQE